MILVCDRVSENGVNRQKAQEWCIKHGFELVELSPEELPDEDDDFPESTGVKRIVQALNANVWSNVVMKGDRTQGFGLLSTLAGANRSRGCEETPETESNPYPGEREESQSDGGEDGAGTHSLEPDSAADPMLDMDIQELASLTTRDGDLENFERLFSKPSGWQLEETGMRLKVSPRMKKTEFLCSWKCQSNPEGMILP
ncbi:alpha- and gamma-adaptin-binding protein p34 isoform X2 [Geospiza fortis]|uniref:Alpha- and gamma-adaptin-binding protein p34 isoform X2 n=1 Tax=Geospiza fortis TaxID=48883 RepID=A0A8N5ER24_GEOFO|nr:alpha- and gamma-adaptin-binding protein p34 isoform X2 [Geospiza fortis]